MKKIDHIDGWLYVGIAAAGCALNHLTTTEAREIFSPAYLFFLRFYADLLGAACLAGKTYRSTTYAETKAKNETNPA